MQEAGLFICGALICVLGITNMKGNVSTIHWYNRHRVTEEDLPIYGKVMGLGTIVVGLGLILANGCMLWKEEFVTPILILSSVIGIGIMLYGLFRYNKGLF